MVTAGMLTVAAPLARPGLADPAPARAPHHGIEPGAGAWKTWVLGSGGELRLPAPPDARTTTRELQALRALAGKRDAAALERIRYWDFWSPAHRWNELLTDAAVAQRLSGVLQIRAFAMLNVALADAMVAAWDSKHAHRRPRPPERDRRLDPAIAPPASPSYPCERSVAAGAASTILAHVFPGEAARFTAAAEEAARSRTVAGVAYPSDTKAGLDLGRAVGARVIEAMRTDGAKWAGTVPTGPGLWQGSNPIGIDEARWRLFVLASASQLRPGPPPAPDSPERAAELAEVRDFARTPATSAKAFYWQFGQQGGAGITFRLSEEIGRRLAEAGLDRNPPRAARAYALAHVAHYESYVAAQEAKYHYWTARPVHFDPGITTVYPTPNFPGYPSNAAALALGAGLVLGHLFPADTGRFEGWAREYGESRIWAGIHFRSDVEAGYAIGRGVAGAVIQRARHDGAE
jgi:PAP2 superfamily